MPILTKLREFLDANGVAYEVLSHPRAITAQEVAAAQHVPGQEMAKVVMVRAGQDYLMAVVPAPYVVDLKSLAQTMGTEGLRLATETEFTGLFPQCEPGAMPPFGNLYGLRVWVDQALTADEEIVFNAGTHEQVARMHYADFARLVRPTVGSFGARRDRLRVPR
jgi:Ala-tRNA(Pro) deacylase